MFCFFFQTADQLNRAFAKYFPATCGVRIIAEPGRFYMSSAFTLVCNITSVRCISSGESKDKNIQKEVCSCHIRFCLTLTRELVAFLVTGPYFQF